MTPFQANLVLFLLAICAMTLVLIGLDTGSMADSLRVIASPPGT